MKYGVEIRLKSVVGKGGFSIQNLWGQGFKAIIVAVGAHKSVDLGIEGEGLTGVYHGISFLKDINNGPPISIGKKVVVVGGGNVAIDAARSANRLGAEEVTVVYRRSKDEMPAYPEEIEEALKEGIKIIYLAAPVKVIGKDDKVKALQCIRTELGEQDESGRRCPVSIDGSEFEIAADTLITAVGETPDIAFLGTTKFLISKKNVLKVHPHSKVTNVAGVFACGDVETGPATVIEAIAAGHKAALGVDKYLRGESLEYEIPSARIIPIEDVDVQRFRKRDRSSMPSLPLNERVGNFNEVEHGLTELMSLKEADRCFQCGLFPKKPVAE
jgi:NADPH-dependent glutamate synthase beta subunit-like oxidoreductase